MREKFNPSAVAAEIVATGGDERDQSFRLAQMFPALRRSSRWRAVADELCNLWRDNRRKQEATGHDAAYL